MLKGEAQTSKQNLILMGGKCWQVKKFNVKGGSVKKKRKLMLRGGADLKRGESEQLDSLTAVISCTFL